jgi:uncharacterized protein (DUF111 family)
MRILRDASAIGERVTLVETGTKERQAKKMRVQFLNVRVKVGLLIDLTSTKLNPPKSDF